ncbi:MAG: stage V sporulation protein AD [Clostridiales bacterium]|nr:stage V sporulation protein AD [Clostridiales bacterium]
MQKGRQTWWFENAPSLICGAAVGAKMESEGPFSASFDYLYPDMRAGSESFEKAEQSMIGKACEIALQKASLQKNEIDVFIAGDLLNQITSSNFTARTLGCAYLGIFGACSTSMEGLALAALLVSGGFSRRVLTATVSHNATAERQFRYPNEYGIQKPPASQFTATAAGAAIVTEGEGPLKLTCATIGKVVDFGVSDPFNMGAAMAPAAVDTIITHLQERGVEPSYYDVIATGDLGRVGQGCAVELFNRAGVPIKSSGFVDCGDLLYGKEQPVFSGGSGCGCMAAMGYGHFLRLMQKGELKRLLLVATGALLSPLTYQQNESIPCVAHAVAIEANN